VHLREKLLSDFEIILISKNRNILLSRISIAALIKKLIAEIRIIIIEAESKLFFV